MNEDLFKQKGINPKLWEYCYITEEGIIYPPHAKPTPIKIEVDGEEIIDYEYEIITTGEEIYRGTLNQKPQPNKMEALECRVASLESVNAGLLLENAQQQIKLQEYEAVKNEQAILNANMLLEIAMLKGVI